jgi:hypothetical protein
VEGVAVRHGAGVADHLLPGVPIRSGDMTPTEVLKILGICLEEAGDSI